jgi:hypothetical protein
VDFAVDATLMKERRVLCFQAPSFLMRPYKAKPVRVFGFEEIREAHKVDGI